MHFRSIYRHKQIVIVSLHTLLLIYQCVWRNSAYCQPRLIKHISSFTTSINFSVSAASKSNFIVYLTMLLFTSTNEEYPLKVHLERLHCGFFLVNTDINFNFAKIEMHKYIYCVHVCTGKDAP